MRLGNHISTVTSTHPGCLSDNGVSKTRKVPSNEGGSLIGSSHSLTRGRSTTVFKTLAFVHSAIPLYGGQPEHYRHENAL